MDGWIDRDKFPKFRRKGGEGWSVGKAEPYPDAASLVPELERCAAPGWASPEPPGCRRPGKPQGRGPGRGGARRAGVWVPGE
jgi:hypothetical protein